MRKYLDLTTWILLFAMAPLTILILLSQNTIPGDLFYPVKRGMENVILAAASVNPSTRVAFRTDLTERRFQEAQQLLVIKADPTAFSDFVTQVSTTQQDLSSFSNQQDKIQLSEKLIAKIDQYQNQLTQVQNQVQIAQQSSPQNIQTQLTQTPIPTQTFSPTSSISPSQAVQNPTPTPFQTTQPSTAARTVTPTFQPSQSIAPTQQPAQNTSVSTTQPTEQPVTSGTPIPTIQPQAVSAIANNPIQAAEVTNTITNTQEELKKIKQQLQKDKEDAQIEQKVQEDQQKFQQELKRRQDNGNNNH